MTDEELKQAIDARLGELLDLGVEWDDPTDYPMQEHDKATRDIMQLIEEHYSGRDQRVRSHREKIERLLTAEVVYRTADTVSEMTVLEKRDFAEHLRDEGYSLEQTRRVMGLKHKSNVQYLLQSYQTTNTKDNK